MFFAGRFIFWRHFVKRSRRSKWNSGGLNRLVHHSLWQLRARNAAFNKNRSSGLPRAKRLQKAWPWPSTGAVPTRSRHMQASWKDTAEPPEKRIFSSRHSPPTVYADNYNSHQPVGPALISFYFLRVWPIVLRKPYKKTTTIGEVRNNSRCRCISKSQGIMHAFGRNKLEIFEIVDEAVRVRRRRRRRR